MINGELHYYITWEVNATVGVSREAKMEERDEVFLSIAHHKGKNPHTLVGQ